MSKDDDFCSHCGSAVWGEDFVSNDAAINCDSLENHTHDKVTYNRTERGEAYISPRVTSLTTRQIRMLRTQAATRRKMPKPCRLS